MEPPQIREEGAAMQRAHGGKRWLSEPTLSKLHTWTAMFKWRASRPNWACLWLWHLYYHTVTIIRGSDELCRLSRESSISRRRRT